MQIRATQHQRQILEGMLWVMGAGTAWRQLPSEFGPWQTVYYYFRQWRRDGTWFQIHAHLRELARLHAGRDPTPSKDYLLRRLRHPQDALIAFDHVLALDPTRAGDWEQKITVLEKLGLFASVKEARRQRDAALHRGT